MCWCVSYNSADLTMVEVLQPANLSHPSLVFGTCADVYPSIKHVRQENVVDLMLGQYRQPICLLFPHFFCEAATFAQRNYWRNGWDNNPILPFWCMFKCFFWMELKPRSGLFANMHSGDVQDHLSHFGDRMCDSLLAMASHFHISRPRSPRATGSVFGLCLPTLLILSFNH